MKIKVIRIFKIAFEFRNAIENLTQEQRGLIFRDFPFGCCGDTSLMLGAYLQKNKLGDFDYVCGHMGRQSHAWLEKGGIIVDITGDQFKGCEKVYVGKANEFYINMEDINRHSYNVSLDGNKIESDRLYPVYREIVKLIK